MLHNIYRSHMACKAFNMGLVLVLVAVMLVHASAQPNCTPTIMTLAPCLGFISGNSSTPSSSCCTQLASVVQTQAQCLCTVLNGAPQLPFVVTQTQALTLPGACKIQTPPLSQCNGAAAAAGGPGSPQGAPAPAASTTPSAAAAPAAPSTPTPVTPATPSNASPTTPSTSGSGSKTVPTTSQTSSAKCAMNFAPPILFVLFLASAFSSF